MWERRYGKGKEKKECLRGKCESEKRKREDLGKEEEFEGKTKGEGKKRKC